MEKQVVTSVESIFEQGNKHLKSKLKYFGRQGQKVVKYIISKLRKYKGDFFESNSTIAGAVGVSVRTVQNSIKRAEQLEIFIVSSRKESTLNGKMRQTTNKIQLLSYEAVEIVKTVVEEVRTVASKVVRRIQKRFVSNGKNKSLSVSYKPSEQKQNGSKEIVPEWFKNRNKPYDSPIYTPEEDAAFQKKKAEIEEILREKFGRKQI